MKLFFSAISCLLLLSSCYFCLYQKDLGELRFTDEDLTISPYEINDTLIFVNNFNDTITYMCSHKDIFTFYSDDCIECCPDIYVKDLDEKTHFDSDSSTFYFSLTTYINDDHESLIADPYFVISWTYLPSPNTQYHNRINSFSNDIPVYELRQTAIHENWFKEKLKLKDKFYDEVYVILGYNNANQSIDTMFYTETQGIIGFTAPPETLWILQ